MISQDTYDQINDWATDKYASSAAASLTATAAPASTGVQAANGMLDAGTISAAPASTAPAAAATPSWAMATATPATAVAAPAAKAAPDIGSWYTQDIGRTADASGLAYWQGRAAESGADPDVLRQEFDRQAVVNGEFKKPAAAPAPAISTAPSLIDAAALAHRTIDQPTQTVAGQLKTVLSADSPVLQQARADAMRSANERGMLNSAMAASGGEDAAIRSALSIASPDAGYYNHAADYNAAADNQATMWNAGAQNDFAKQQIQINADTAARNAQLGQQMTLAQMQDATSRYAADTSSATSKYNTDASFRNQAENNKKTLVNNIIGNMDLAPDRKAAMLEQLGEGTSTVRAADGTIKPGSGLAGAVYVIDSVAADLKFNDQYAAGG